MISKRRILVWIGCQPDHELLNTYESQFPGPGIFFDTSIYECLSASTVGESSSTSNRENSLESRIVVSLTLICSNAHNLKIGTQVV